MYKLPVISFATDFDNTNFMLNMDNLLYLEGGDILLNGLKNIHTKQMYLDMGDKTANKPWDQKVNPFYYNIIKSAEALSINFLVTRTNYVINTKKLVILNTVEIRDKAIYILIMELVFLCAKVPILLKPFGIFMKGIWKQV